MKYIKTAHAVLLNDINDDKYYKWLVETEPVPSDVIAEADTIEELLDEVVLIEKGIEHNIVFLPEAYDRINEYHNRGNYKPRLIGRIKAGLDKKAVAEWKENEEGLYDWILL